MRRRREDEEKREQEKETNREAIRRRREDKEKREQERESNKEAMRRRREDKEKMEHERETNREAIRHRREDEKKREQERETNKEAMRRRREDEEKREQEKETNREAMRRRREDEEKREQERKINKEAMRRRREDEEKREEERRKDAVLKRLRRKEQQIESQARDAAASRASKDVLDNYFLRIKCGPTWCCVSCENLFFQKSVSVLKGTKLNQNMKQVLQENIPSTLEDESIVLCSTCKASLLVGKVPRLCVANGLKFPEIPSTLPKMTPLEERLVSPRIPFMNIRPLGVDRQFGAHGSVVNVPVSVETMVSVLPRMPDETHTIQLKLMRRMNYKHPFIFETIRPAVVHQWAAYLVQQPLYVEQGITLAADYLAQHQEEEENFIIHDEDESDDPYGEEVLPEDTWNETVDDEEPLNPGGQETLLEACSSEEGIKFAPGEGQKPLPLFLDENAEELSFPSIYLGQKRKAAKNVSVKDVAKSELRRKDRRCANSIPNLFYKHMRCSLATVAGSISLCLRKKRNVEGITAAALLNNEVVDGIVRRDEGFRVLRAERSSPAFWEAKKKDLMAMIRQLGCPTMFFTCSAAESRWVELIVILKEVTDGEKITEEEAENLPYAEKRDLIRRDPVTTARYFDHKMRELFKVLQSSGGPFNEHPLIDFYIRVEFQHRGSPHIHCLLWLANAPHYDEEKPECNALIEDFVDKYISCDVNHDLAELQKHKHSPSCKKVAGSKIFCRFGMPVPPMTTTRILLPLEKKERTKEMEEMWKKIELLTQDVAKGLKPLSNFEDFLAELKIGEEAYIKTVQSSLTRPTLFLKRDLESLLVNCYNPLILTLCRSNIDLQYILDPYACAQYIINYVSKSNRNMSRLMREAVEQLREGNYSIKERLRKIANVFLNSSEVSAQEAVYLILGMPLSRASRSVVFINTSPPEERVKIAKSEDQLRALNPSSKNVFVAGLIEHYIQRPQELEQLCLADFAASYTFSRTQRSKVKEDDHDEREDNDNDDAEVDLPNTESAPGKWLKLLDDSGYVCKKTRERVIRVRRYIEAQDPLNYYRESIMLFVPWRDETEEILSINIQEKYLQFKDGVKEKMSHYFRTDVEEIIQGIVDTFDEDINAVRAEEEISDQPAKSAQDVASSEFSVFGVSEHQADIFQAMGSEPTKENVEHFKPPMRIPDEDYHQMVRTLNPLQRQYLLHVLHNLTCGITFHEFVSGGAGTGKSRLIKAIYQTGIRYFSSIPGSNPDVISILLSAPTGKAAHNIEGATLHSLFRLPVSQFRMEMPEMSADIANQIGSRFLDVKLLIIDEISMVGQRQLAQVDKRLKQIFRSSDSFGGISVLCVGDFRQLKPVGDSYVFSPDKSNSIQALGPSLWENFKLFELQDIMRQKDDRIFAAALNHVASGSTTPEDVALFKSREVADESCIPRTALRLFASNAEVDAYNSAILSSMDGPSWTAKAIDVCSGDASEELKSAVLTRLATASANDTLGLPHTLTLKLGVQYMMRVNVNTSDGLVNGAVGRLRKVDTGSHRTLGEIPIRVWIEFEDQSTGKEARAAFTNIMKAQEVKETWTPVEPVCRQLSAGRHKNLQVLRKQFPLVPAEAITIHKSQGATYSQVAVKLKKGIDRSALYVALSRATTSNSLYLIGEFRPPTEAPMSHPVVAEMERMRKESLAKLAFDSTFFPSQRKKIYFHNAQSLHRHFNDMICDNTILNEADIIMIVETWSLESDEYCMPGFRCIFRRDGEKRRSAVGSSIFVKEDADVFTMAQYFARSKGAFVDCNAVRYLDTVIIMLYKSPKMKEAVLFEALESVLAESKGERIIIVGDFNVDWKKKEQRETERLRTFMDNLGCRMILPNQSSTNGGSQIDLCFTNIETATSAYYVSTFSYHKPVWIFL